ncbi:SUMF1/EgtB/PvdO family nonheme iron enzyme, partial [Vibrio parahaemolyticus]
NRYTDSSLSLFPADSISWEDAKAFIAQLNKLLSAMKAQGKTFPFKQFRLPADVEWEFAALNAASEEQTALNTVSWNVTNSNKKA